MVLCDGDERLTLNMRHDTSSYSNQPQRESINMFNIFNDSSEDFLEDLFSNQPSDNLTFSSHPELTSLEVKNDTFDSEGGNVLSEKLLDLDSTKDLHPPLHDNQLSGNTTYSFSLNLLLEEFADELALITIPPKYDDDLYLKDSIDQKNLANLADIFVDSMPEMFTDEHALDYSSHPIFDEYDDDFLEVGSDTENIYDDPFDSKGEKIKESKLLIDELDIPCDFLSFEYESFISQDFYRVDALPSTNNEDKVFNPGILIQENPFEIITRVVQDKKLASSNASSMLTYLILLSMNLFSLNKFPGNGYDKNGTKSGQRTKSRTNGKRGKVRNQARQSQSPGTVHLPAPTFPPSPSPQPEFHWAETTRQEFKGSDDFVQGLDEMKGLDDNAGLLTKEAHSKSEILV
nr:hypothetical protein [Tanacetum cinerariifolium]